MANTRKQRHGFTAAPLTGFAQYQRCFQGSATQVWSLKICSATATFLTQCWCKLGGKQGDSNTGPGCKGWKPRLLQRCFSPGLWCFTPWSEPSKGPEPCLLFSQWNTGLLTQTGWVITEMKTPLFLGWDCISFFQKWLTDFLSEQLQEMCISKNSLVTSHPSELPSITLLISWTLIIHPPQALPFAFSWTFIDWNPISYKSKVP